MAEIGKYGFQIIIVVSLRYNPGNSNVLYAINVYLSLLESKQNYLNARLKCSYWRAIIIEK